MRVGFYVGCGINYLMPEVGKSSVEALKRMGAEVIVPEGQVCCGMPVLSLGDITTARNLALKNLDAFEGLDLDYIATSCATCGHSLKSVFTELLSSEGPEMKVRVEAFASRVRDITELLTAGTGYGNGSIKPGAVVTYHDPCHLSRYQGIKDEPRALIAGNKNLVFREMRHPCSCCGLGGGVGFSNYELSTGIIREKVENIRESGAEIVATACPGCIVQLRDGLRRFGVKARAVHVVELI